MSKRTPTDGEPKPAAANPEAAQPRKPTSIEQLDSTASSIRTLTRPSASPVASASSRPRTSRRSSRASRRRSTTPNRARSRAVCSTLRTDSDALHAEQKKKVQDEAAKSGLALGELMRALDERCRPLRDLEDALFESLKKTGPAQLQALAYGVQTRR